MWRAEGRTLSDKGWVPLRYWAMWWTALGLAVVLFYVILTPLWMGLRAAAWIAELHARVRPERDHGTVPTRGGGHPSGTMTCHGDDGSTSMG